MEYHSYQKSFTDALTNPEDSPTFFRTAAQNKAALAIYRNNVVYSLREALAENFPVIKRLLGEERFNQIGAEFVRTHLPQNTDLSSYGEFFGAMLKAHQALAAYPYMGDVASLEWACRQSVNAKTDLPLDRARLHGLDDDGLAAQKFSLRACVRLLQLDWAADEIWQAHQAEVVAELELVPRETHLLICRDEEPKRVGVADIFRLAADISLFLSSLNGKNTLGEAVALTMKKFPNFDLANGLSLCLTKQLLK